MRITVSHPPITSKTLAQDLPLQTWVQKLGQHVNDASSVQTVKADNGEILTASRSGSRIYWEYSGTIGGSWVFFGVPITLQASATPQQGWTHLKEAPNGSV